MIYTFYIETNNGVIAQKIDSHQDFSCAPFGFVAYRQKSSCTCTQEVLDDFWNCIDLILTTQNMTSVNFIRAIKCTSDSGTYGEQITHELS